MTKTRIVLRAKFRDSGETVIYEDVPQEIYDSLIFADSIGGFFRDHIEGRYPARKRLSRRSGAATFQLAASRSRSRAAASILAWYTGRSVWAAKSRNCAARTRNRAALSDLTRP